MPLTIPTLDDRRYAELLDEALARIPIHNPEWTNFNRSDPGVTHTQPAQPTTLAIADDGKVTLIGHQSTNGKVPRNFLVDPKGEYIFVANQDSDSIHIFKVNAKTGKLTPVGKTVSVPSPVCLKLVNLN